MEAELSSEVGAAGRLFKSCVDLFWALLQRILVLDYEEKFKDNLRAEFGKFYIWGDGYRPFEGILDAILDNSSRLKLRVISVLMEVGEILCRNHNSLFMVVGRSFSDHKLNDQRLELRAMLESLQDNLCSGNSDESDVGSDSTSNASESTNFTEDIIDELRSRNQCLADLSGVLDRPAADADLGESEASNLVAFKVSGAAEIWTRKIVDNFPDIDVMLAERLGEANWQRYQRISQRLEQIHSFDSQSESSEDDDDVGELPEFTENTKSSANPTSIFSSAGKETANTGTSISNTDFNYAFPRVRKRRAAKDLISQATYTSVMTNDRGERGWLKIPAMPKNASSGKAFRCTICGDKQMSISNLTEWKKHVFTDLQPYMCLFPDCRRTSTFMTRKAWADHEFSMHRSTKIWTCNDCAAQFRAKADFREHAYSSHGNVLMRNQLEALVNSAEKQISKTENNPCPFCSEMPGAKSRVFAMHVGRHMEEIALAVLPRDTEFESDQASLSSDHSPSSKTEPGNDSGLDTLSISGYEARMFCALRLYLSDPQGHQLSDQDICGILGILPKDSDGDIVAFDKILPHIQRSQSLAYSEVVHNKAIWGIRANEIYQKWRKGKTKDGYSQPPGGSGSVAADLTRPEHSSRGINTKDAASTKLEGKISIQDFDFLAVLDRNGYSKIMLAEMKMSKELFAIKVIKKELVIENDESKEVMTERNVHLRVTQERHPFIVQVCGAFQTETRLYFVSEYLGGGDLMSQVQRGQIGNARACFYAAEVCLALKFLHENEIIYRNLRLENVWLTLDGHIKITDFRFAKPGIRGLEATSTFCGTAEFMAPEILLDKKYGSAVDWWSFGVLLYQMLLRKSPFAGDDEDDIYDAILADEPLYPIHTPRRTLSLLQGLLMREPTLRLGSGPTGAKEVMDHLYFRQINWTDLYLMKIPPPFVPKIENERDVGNFDSELTTLTPKLTPVQSVLTQAMQEEFRGFSFNNVVQ